MKLNFKVQGQGPPLIILHGLFGSLDNWQSLAKRWAEDYTVFTVDHRNHGRSPHADEMNYRLMAMDLKELMEDNFAFKTHLLGHSMGGKTVMRFALDYPDMVDKLVVADMSPSAYEAGHTEIFKALFEANVGEATSRQEVEDALAKRIPQADVRQFLMKGLYRKDGNHFAWRYNLRAIYDHYDEILSPLQSDHSFDGPSLFIRGDRSNYVTEKKNPEIKALFPEARIESIPAGHWLHAENPKAFFEVVSGFLSH